MQTDKHDRIHQMTDDAIEQLRANLEAGKSDALKQFLTAMAKFHRYSFGNQLLIAFQMPTATHVAGFHGWKKHNRFVKKGEKGILIIAPVTKKVRTVDERQADGSVESKDIRAAVNFRAAYVFDVSQTDGEPLPEFAKVSGDCAEQNSKLDQFIMAKGITLSYASDLGGAQGCSSGKHISILQGLPSPEEFAVKVHEVAHELLHQGERKGQTTKTVRETEAEAVAFIVCNAVGLDCSTAASDYISLYQGHVDTLQESLHFIRATASEIIAAITPSDDAVVDA